MRAHGNTARGDPEANLQELQKTEEHAELWAATLGLKETTGQIVLVPLQKHSPLFA